MYLSNLAKGLGSLGHHVEVVSGPPYPVLHNGIPLHKMPSLDLYNPDDLFRIPGLGELKDPVNLMEWIGVITMGFPEPKTFGLRACQYLRQRKNDFDVVHDNQTLSYGIWAIGRSIPTIATIHHPITVDRRFAISSVRAPWKKLKHLRWYSFIEMQKRVARTFERILTVSECAGDDVSREFDIPRDRFRVAPNGIAVDKFYPIPEISREPGRLIVTNSADMPLKGLYHLLHAVKEISGMRDIRLTVIGTPKKNGGIEKLVRTLGIGNLITFTGRVDDEEFVRHYARASIAVVPSMYEGFGLPAGEAMACAVPVISTTGGALPEVVGDAGILVPPGDPAAITRAVIRLLDNPEKAEELGRTGYKRVHAHFTWERAAEKTVSAYREVIRAHRGF